jgi:trk system potassium uptake protein TrkA
MQQSKNILLLGLGGVGYYLAKRLSHEGHAITAVEHDPETLRRADGEIDARLIRANAMSFRGWAEADAKQMDYMIAVTDHDAINIVGTLIAHRCGIRRKIARVRSLEVWESDALLTAEDLDIDLVIRPEELTAQEIARLLKIRAGNTVIELADGQMQVLATRIDDDSPLAGARLNELAPKHDDFYFRVVSIARGISTIIPAGDEELRPRDNAFILVRGEDLPRVMELAKVTQKPRGRVLIIGGGLVGSRVAQLLEDHLPVRLIEEDAVRAEELSHSLRKTELLHGDGSDGDTLMQAGLLDTDAIVAATGDNETNIMSCVLAKSVIASHVGEQAGRRRKTIALVGREEYLVLASSMGADLVLSSKVMAANEILKYIRRGQLLSVAHLHGFEAEVVELVVGPAAPITGRPLHQVEGLRGKIIIGGFFRDEQWQTAVGSTRLEPADKVIAVCISKHLKELQGLVLG